MTQRAKIAILSIAHPLIFRGGAQQSAYFIFKALQMIGYDSIFVAADSASANDSMRKAGKYVRPCSFGPGEYFYSSGQYNHFWNRVVDAYPKRELIDFLRNSLVTHVFVSHFVPFGLDLVPLLKAAGFKVYVGFHEMLAWCYASGQMITTRTREICTTAAPELCIQCFPEHHLDDFAVRAVIFRSYLADADGYISPSEFLRKGMESWGLDSSKINVVYHPVSEYLRPKEAPKPPRSGTAIFRFGYFGQVYENKGVLILLQAGKILDGLVSTDFEIVLNGANMDMVADSNFRSKYQELIDDSGKWNRGKVFERGSYSHDLLPLRMQEVDIVVVPSLWPEIYCMVVDEAKASSRPIIASNLGGLPERISREDGLLFAAGDAHALACTMRKMMDEISSFNPCFPEKQAMMAIASRYAEIFELTN